MANKHAQWVQKESGLSQVLGRLVADGDGYTIETSGNADAHFTADDNGVSIDSTATSGRRIATVNGFAQVV